MGQVDKHDSDYLGLDNSRCLILLCVLLSSVSLDADYSMRKRRSRLCFVFLLLVPCWGNECPRTPQLDDPEFSQL